MTEVEPEYVAARRTLLDALDVLVAHRHSLILIGAQAVYLHTGSQGMSVPPMTTDADLALDADLLADDPEIAATMQAAGFKSGQPGLWENAQGVAVDLMVAPHQSNRESPKARSARLAPHANTVARIGSGLAAAYRTTLLSSSPPSTRQTPASTRFGLLVQQLCSLPRPSRSMTVLLMRAENNHSGLWIKTRSTFFGCCRLAQPPSSPQVSRPTRPTPSHTLTLTAG